MFCCRKLVVAAAFALSAVSPFAMPSANAEAPVIISAIPNLVSNHLTINGTHMCCKAASVLLGPTGPLTVVSQTATQLVVILPVPPLPAGDYVLSVQIGHGNDNSDQSVVTIGAVGPTGPAGATGPAGTNGMNGATGATGPAGAIGPQGIAGPTGATGSIGPIGPAGPNGLAGAMGAAGPVGPTGAPGQVVVYTFASTSPNGLTYQAFDVGSAGLPDGAYLISARMELERNDPNGGFGNGNVICTMSVGATKIDDAVVSVPFAAPGDDLFSGGFALLQMQGVFTGVPTTVDVKCFGTGTDFFITTSFTRNKNNLVVMPVVMGR